MGFMDKIKGMVNPESIDDNYDDEYVFDGDDDAQNGANADPNYNYDEDYQQTQQAPAQNGYNAQQRGAQYQPQQQANAQPVSFNTNNTEIKVVRPERFDSVKQIADHLLNRRTVVLNLEATNKENSRRIIDFLSGVTYSINGNLRKVANNTFVITPNNVEVSGEQVPQQPQPQPQPQQPMNDPYNTQI